MATEKTSLLGSYIVNIPKDDNCNLTEYDKTKGLSLEELLPFENDPWWQNLRKTFFLSYWITVIVIFLTACILSIVGNDSCQNVGMKISNGSKQQLLLPSTEITIKELTEMFTSATLLTQNIENNVKNTSNNNNVFEKITEKFIKHTNISKLQ